MSYVMYKRSVFYILITVYSLIWSCTLLRNVKVCMLGLVSIDWVLKVFVSKLFGVVCTTTLSHCCFHMFCIEITSLAIFCNVILKV